MIESMHAHLDTASSIETRFERVRAYSKRLFGLLTDEAFDERPIPLRHPPRFYEGHLAAFNLNTLQLGGILGEKPQEEFCRLFARGIDPDDEARAAEQSIQSWPPREEVAGFIEEADRVVRNALRDDSHRAVALTCIEHEEMHQETLLYIIHQLNDAFKSPPSTYAPQIEGRSPEWTWIDIPEGSAKLGAAPGEIDFGWDNEFDARSIETPAFRILTHKVTNQDFLAFIEAGGYRDPKWWNDDAWEALRRSGREAPPFWSRRANGWHLRTLFGETAIPPAWPVVVPHDDAAAFCRWKGVRLPTEAEWNRAVQAGNLGEKPPLFDGDGLSFHPVNADGVPELDNGLVEPFGNGWEWTATPFSSFPAFKPAPYYPGYSADFFDGKHFVLKGASPVTPREMIRPTFRNWFYHDYPYAYTTFRCVTDE